MKNLLILATSALCVLLAAAVPLPAETDQNVQLVQIPLEGNKELDILSEQLAYCDNYSQNYQSFDLYFGSVHASLQGHKLFCWAFDGNFHWMSSYR